jgi:drug/metabolite transporter (DMT)-like permease
MPAMAGFIDDTPAVAVSAPEDFLLDRTRSHRLGLVLLFGAGALWSLNGALINLIYAKGEGPHGVTIACYRSLVAGIFLLPLGVRGLATLRRREGLRFLGGVRPAAFSCAIFFTLMTACFVVANTMTEAANAIILQYTSTFWIFGLSPLVLGERPHRRDLGIVVLAMVGVGIIFAGNASTSAAGLVIALAAGLFYALLTLMIRRMRDSDSAAITVVNNLGAAALLFPIVWVLGEVWVSWRSAVLLLIMGVVQFGVPYYLYTLGLARVPAYQAALITMIEPVLVPLWTYLAVRQPVPKMTAVGGAVILAALLWFVHNARARTKAGT